MAIIKIFINTRDNETYSTKVYINTEEVASNLRSVLFPTIVHVGIRNFSSTEVTGILGCIESGIVLSAVAIPFFTNIAVSKPISIAGIKLFPCVAVDNIQICTICKPSIVDGFQNESIVCTSEPKSWLRLLVGESEELLEKALSSGIFDEDSYLKREGELGQTARRALGIARFQALLGKAPTLDCMLGQLHLAPPWLLASSLASFPFSNRASHIFSKSNLYTVADLLKIRDELPNINGMGRKTYQEIEDVLYSQMLTGPMHMQSGGYSLSSSSPEFFISTNEPTTSTIPKINLVDNPKEKFGLSIYDCSFHEVCEIDLGRMQPRDAAILAARMGWKETPRTLQEIAESIGLTRERVRQIERRANDNIPNIKRWLNESVTRLDIGLSNGEDPLPADSLPVMDRWFSGIDLHLVPFTYLLEYHGMRFRLINIEGEMLITERSLDEYYRIRDVAISMIEASGAINRSIKSIKEELELCLTSTSQRFIPYILRYLKRVGRTYNGKDGEERITAIDDTTNAIARSILSSSPSPMHYRDVARAIKLKYGIEYDVRLVHRWLGKVGFLFSRGTYGLEKHFPLDEQASLAITDVVEDLLAGDMDKQWHCDEIIENLTEYQCSIAKGLTSYVLDIILRRYSHKLRPMNRLTWINISESSKDAERLGIKEAIVQALEKAGRPLNKSEVLEYLVQYRGTSSFLQIHPGDRLIRISEGEWGLIDRDLPIPIEMHKQIESEVLTKAYEQGKGIHITNLRSLLSCRDTLQNGVDPISISSMLVIRGRIRMDRSSNLFPAEWEDAHCISIRDAVTNIFAGSSGKGLSLENIVSAVSTLMSRSIPSPNISSVLQNLDVYYSRDDGLWYFDPDALDDEEIIKS